MREMVSGRLEELSGFAGVESGQPEIRQIYLTLNTAKGKERVYVEPSWGDIFNLLTLPLRTLELQELCQKKEVVVTIKARKRFGNYVATEAALVNMLVEVRA